MVNQPISPAHAVAQFDTMLAERGGHFLEKLGGLNLPQFQVGDAVATGSSQSFGAPSRSADIPQR